MSKQDRVYTRTASDLERKYNFGKRFAEILGVATDAQDTALAAAEAIKQFNENLTPEQIFDLLTGGGVDQGVYRENGKIYLNANYIKTGFISSDLIKAGVIRSLDYEQIPVDEYYPAEDLYPDVDLYPNDGKDITKGMEIDFAAGVIRVGGEYAFDALTVYPVGSIYMSVNSTSPAELFSGTWEQLKDRFLLSAGNTYKAGATGGEATHTLTVDEMPSHNHASADSSYFYTTQGTTGGETSSGFAPGGYFAGSDASAGFRRKNVTASAGSGQAHNNMPPYLAVYVWKRIA